MDTEIIDSADSFIAPLKQYLFSIAMPGPGCGTIYEFHIPMNVFTPDMDRIMQYFEDCTITWRSPIWVINVTTFTGIKF